MATIATLVAQLVGDTRGFSKSFASAGKVIGRFKGLIALAGIGLGVGFLDAQLKAADAMGKLADRTGVSIERLSGLQFAAEQAGSSVEGMTVGITKMLRSVSDATSGNAMLAETFKELGVDVAAIKNLKADEQFGVIADALNGVESAADKTRIAMEIFGKSGADLIPLISEGSEGLAAYQKQAERLGRTMSREQAAKAEQANDAMNRLTTAVKSTAMVIVTTAAPAIELFANIMERVVTFVRNLTAFLGDGATVIFRWVAALTAVTTAVVAVVAVGAYLVRTLRSVAVAISTVLSLSGPQGWALLAAGLAVATGAAIALNAGFEETVSSADDAAAAASRFEAASTDMTSAAESAAAAQAKVVATLKEQVATYGLSERQITLYKLAQEGASKATMEQAKALVDQLNAMDATKDRIEQAAENMERLKQAGESVFEATRTPLEQYEARVAELNTLVNAGVIAWETYGRAVDQARGQLESARKEKESLDKHPAVIQFGSQEAIRFDRQSENNRRMEKLVDVGEKQLAVERQQLDVLNLIGANISQPESQTVTVNF